MLYLPLPGAHLQSCPANIPNIYMSFLINCLVWPRYYLEIGKQQQQHPKTK